MIILAIETSCDDTCVAIIKVEGKKNPRFKILSNIISSQVMLHKKYGGVYPSLAKREHQKNLPIVLAKSLRESKNQEVNLMAVTVGPGLEPCLWVGLNFAKELAKKMKIPIAPVNHIEAHIFANFIEWNSILLKSKIFPAVCLVVSGGHTQLILMKDVGKYKILGQTRDDAAGECFDKVARILGLGYPGGPAIAATTAKFSISNFQFSINLPRPMIYQKNYDFSFSGLKTAVLYDFKSRSKKVRESKEYIQEMSAAVQQAVIDVLINKTLKAAKDFKVKSIILGGGVAANEELRKQFELKIQNTHHFQIAKLKIQFLVPPKILCTDNAIMTAVTAHYHWIFKKRFGWKKIEANANLKIGEDLDL